MPLVAAKSEKRAREVAALLQREYGDAQCTGPRDAL